MDTPDNSWPPTKWTIPGETTFEPPEVFQPKQNRPAVPLDGESLIVPPPPGSPDPGLPDAPSESHQQRMTVSWARETLRSCQRYYRVARLCAWTDWAIDKAEDWSPTEHDLKNSLATWWVAGHEAVSAYLHLQAWRSQLDNTSVDDLLRQLRNSLIHLDEARLDVHSAHTIYDSKGKPSKGRDIAKLPGGDLPLAFSPRCVDALFGFIELRDVHQAITPHLRWAPWGGVD